MTAGDDRQQLPYLHEARVARRESLVNKDKFVQKCSNHRLDSLHRLAQILHSAREGQPHMARRPKARPRHNGDERIIAYMLLKLGVLDSDRQRFAQLGIPLNPDTDSTLAPSVADDYQNQGVGSILLKHLLQAARHLGRRRVVLWGGVQATSSLASKSGCRSSSQEMNQSSTTRNRSGVLQRQQIG